MGIERGWGFFTGYNQQYILTVHGTFCLSVLLCLRMGRMGPDFMAIVMVRTMHGVMGIRFF